MFVGKDTYADAATYKAKAFTIDQAPAAVEHLNKTYSELSEVV